MNKIRGSIFLKSICFLMQQVFIVMIAISIFIGATYWNYEDASFDIVEQDDFIATNYYKRLVEENIYNLLDYIKYCNKFETNGVFDSSKIVDIDDYIHNDRITGAVTISIGYTIDQLLKWKEEGFTYHSDALNIPSANEGADSFGTTTMTTTRMNEFFTNTSGISILDYATANSLDYQSVCDSIESATTKLEKEIIEYKTQISTFKLNNTNLRYAIQDNDLSVFYTNLETASITEGRNIISHLGSYVLLDATTADFTSNLFYANENLNRYLNTLYLDNKDCTILIGVDTNFPSLDIFYKEKLQYQKMEGSFQIFFRLLIISIIGLIICLFFLSAAAGHKRNTDTIVRTSLEKIRTEFALLLFALSELFFFYRLVLLFHDITFPTVNMMNLFLIGIHVFCMSVLFTISYLSFLRRLKLGILLRESLSYSVCSFIRRIFVNRRVTLKFFLFYSTFLCLLFITWLYTDSFWKPILIFFECFFFGLYLLAEALDRQIILNGTKKIASGDLEFQINTNRLHYENKLLGEHINKVREGLQAAVEDSMNNERMKTDLITNVSHDIKTPLTSIINYVTLLKRIPIQDERARQYIAILDEKSNRLKHLTEDLVEASKISSGNITLTMAPLNFVELIHQTGGEFTEKFEERSLTLVTTVPDEPIMIEADGRRLWRILENIYGNAAKYAMEHTRIYADLSVEGDFAVFSLKNISTEQLNIDAEELTKRFIRGDISRTTEGSGLGLSIAKNLTELQGGTFETYLDGDLFRITIQMSISHKDMFLH